MKYPLRDSISLRAKITGGTFQICLFSRAFKTVPSQMDSDLCYYFLIKRHTAQVSLGKHGRHICAFCVFRLHSVANSSTPWKEKGHFSRRADCPCVATPCLCAAWEYNLESKQTCTAKITIAGSPDVCCVWTQPFGTFTLGRIFSSPRTGLWFSLKDIPRFSFEKQQAWNVKLELCLN